MFVCCRFYYQLLFNLFISIKTETTSFYMKSIMLIQNKNSGFMATVSIILISLGVIAFSLSVSSGAVLYADFINKKEMRIQAGFNLEACKEIALQQFKRNYIFLKHIDISELGCSADLFPNGLYKTIKLNAAFGGTRVATSTVF